MTKLRLTKGSTGAAEASFSSFPEYLAAAQSTLALDLARGK